MAFHPNPFDRVAGAGRVQRLPQIDILDRFAGSCFSAAPLPIIDPACNAVLDVNAVSNQPNFGSVRHRA